MRMFRRRPGREWQGRVHEQILWSLPTWLPERMQQTTIRVDHFGYLASVIDDRDKHERNLELLMEQRRRAARRLRLLQHRHRACGDAGLGRGAALVRGGARAAHAPSTRGRSQQFAPTDGAAHRSPLGVRPAMPAGAIALARGGAGLVAGVSPTSCTSSCSSTSAAGRGRRRSSRHAARWSSATHRRASSPASGKGSFQARTMLAACLREQGDVDAAPQRVRARGARRRRSS